MSTPLRVLHVASGDLWAGAEVALFHLARALSASPLVAIEVVLLNEGELAARLRGSGIRVHVFDEQSQGMLGLLLRLNAVIRRFGPAIVHTHRGKEHLLGAVAAAPVPGVISLRTVHGATETIDPRHSRLRRLAMQGLNRGAAGLQRCAIAVSDPLATVLAGTLPGMPVHVIPNGVDAAAIEAAAAGSCPLVRTDRIAICFSGRLVPVKRVEVFLAAARAILDAYPDHYAFYVIGDGPLRQTLEGTARQLGLGENCIFTGFLPNALPCLRKAAAVVLTSDHEGTPMVALEALALGVPVVAHAVGGLVPLLRSPEQGRLVWDQDPLSIASAVLSVAPPGREGPATRNSLLPAAYTVEHCAAAHLALYRALVRR